MPKGKSVLLWLKDEEWAAILSRTKPREASKFVREAIREKLGMASAAVDISLPTDYGHSVYVLADHLADLRERTLNPQPEPDPILEKFLAHNPHIAEMLEPEAPSLAVDNLPVDWPSVYREASGLEEGEALRMLKDRTSHIKLPSGFWRMPANVQRQWLESNT